MSLTGDPEGPPTKSGLSLVDFCGGYALSIALLGAVWRARRDGAGADCDLSLFEVALSLLTYVGTWAATEAHEPPRLSESAHPSIVPFQAFRCADGWLTVACAKQKFWERLCAAMELEELLEDDRFADLDGRYAHRDPLLSILRAHFLRANTAAWVTKLESAGVPVGRVNNVGEALFDPQAQARNAVVTYEHPRLGKVNQIASPLRISGHECQMRPAPARGADTGELLRELCGYDDGDLERLSEGGAFGPGRVPLGLTSEQV
jgi:crotonobetainyl-CoA:carnitine CoA-transferase CaiB-like acyl-CoA transferase